MSAQKEIAKAYVLVWDGGTGRASRRRWFSSSAQGLPSSPNLGQSQPRERNVAPYTPASRTNPKAGTPYTYIEVIS